MNKIDKENLKSKLQFDIDRMINQAKDWEDFLKDRSFRI